MSMQKLNRIRNRGAYTAQRSTLEHLLLLEERVLRGEPEEIDIPTTRTFLAQQLQQYKEQNKINNPFGIEDIQQYLLTTAEQEIPWQNHPLRGLYTSTLIQQAEGDTPITIDMQGNKIDNLLYAINTPRHITINNTNGDNTGIFAGSYHGQANLTINNTKGNWTGAYAGSKHGQANLTINNTKGDSTGAFAGSEHGTAHLTINNTNGDCTGTIIGRDRGKAYLTIEKTKGRFTGAGAGIHNGRAIIVAYNNEGKEQFRDHKGILVSYNPEETPRIERASNQKRKPILNLIAQNASPENIMAYLVKNT